MIEARLTHVDIPVHVELIDAHPLNEHSDSIVRISVPKFAMLMDERSYVALLDDPVALSAFIRSKISNSFKATGVKWPHPDVLRASADTK